MIDIDDGGGTETSSALHSRWTSHWFHVFATFEDFLREVVLVRVLPLFEGQRIVSESRLPHQVVTVSAITMCKVRRGFIRCVCH